MSQTLNCTHVALIPKGKKPRQGLTRPISLCNVLHMLEIEIITNRLKLALSDIILESQSAFKKRCLIFDNILVAYEMFHHMHCQVGINGDKAIKMDN